MSDLSYFVEDFSREFVAKGMGGKKFSNGALRVMARHSWPGNVRELRNFIERALIMSREQEVTAALASQMLGVDLDGASAGHDQRQPATGKSADHLYAGLSYKDAKKKFEQSFLITKIAENDGNISKTAEQLGMERSNLHKKMKMFV